jgi:hypothetical protein
MSERPKTSQHGGYRPGSGPKSTLGAKKTGSAGAPPASGVAAYMQERALLRFDRIMDAWMAKAEGCLLAIYDLKKVTKLLEKGVEVSGGVDGLGKPVYVYRTEPETRALEWVSEQLVGKAVTKAAGETDNVYVINHSIPRPDYGEWKAGAAPPTAESELLNASSDEIEEATASPEPLDDDDGRPSPTAEIEEPILTNEQIVHKAIQNTLMARMRSQLDDPNPEDLLRQRLTRNTGTGPVTALTATPVPTQNLTIVDGSSIRTSGSQVVPDFIPDPAAPPSQPVAETPSQPPLKKFFELPL